MNTVLGENATQQDAVNIANMIGSSSRISGSFNFSNSAFNVTFSFGPKTLMVPGPISSIPDWTIAYILLVLGVVGSIAMLGLSPQNAVQGVLVTGAAVLGHQLVKQAANH